MEIFWNDRKEGRELVRLEVLRSSDLLINSALSLLHNWFATICRSDLNIEQIE